MQGSRTMCSPAVIEKRSPCGGCCCGLGRAAGGTRAARPPPACARQQPTPPRRHAPHRRRAALHCQHMHQPVAGGRRGCQCWSSSFRKTNSCSAGRAGVVHYFANANCETTTLLVLFNSKVRWARFGCVRAASRCRLWLLRAAQSTDGKDGCRFLWHTLALLLRRCLVNTWYECLCALGAALLVCMPPPRARRLPAACRPAARALRGLCLTRLLAGLGKASRPTPAHPFARPLPCLAQAASRIYPMTDLMDMPASVETGACRRGRGGSLAGLCERCAERVWGWQARSPGWAQRRGEGALAAAALRLRGAGA